MSWRINLQKECQQKTLYPFTGNRVQEHKKTLNLNYDNVSSLHAGRGRGEAVDTGD